MADKLLEVRDLKVDFGTPYGDVHAVRGVSWELNAGETLAIVGESGCGKTVSCQSIMRLLNTPPAKITSGSVLFEGQDLLKKSDKDMENYRGKELSMIFQDSMTSLNPTMRIGRQLCEGIIKHRKVGRKEAEKIAVDMLRMVRMPNPEQAMKRYPHTMSGGQRQRVMIAMALSCNPKVLFADEPTTALDVTVQAQILDIMDDMKERLGTAIVLITHDLGVVAKMADRINVMYAGEIVERGSADDIFYNSKHPYTWGLLGSTPDRIESRKEKLYSIPGSPPDLFAPPKGCAFAARCEYCMGACLKAFPPEFDLGCGHKAACWLLDKRAKPVISPICADAKAVSDNA